PCCAKRTRSIERRGAACSVRPLGSCADTPAMIQVRARSPEPGASGVGGRRTAKRRRACYPSCHVISDRKPMSVPSAERLRAIDADLHCHSTVSDGWLEPEGVVLRALANGVELLALTDHDEVGGIDTTARVAQAHGLGFVAGVEI